MNNTTPSVPGETGETKLVSDIQFVTVGLLLAVVLGFLAFIAARLHDIYILLQARLRGD